MLSDNAAIRQLAISFLTVIVSLQAHLLVLGSLGSPWRGRLRIAYKVLLTMETLNLKLAILDEEVLNEVLKDVSTVAHQLRSLLVCQNFTHVLVGPLEVGEEQDEHFLRIARDLNQVDLIVNLVEIPVQHLTLDVDAVLIEANVHGRWSLLRHYVNLVLRLLNRVLRSLVAAVAELVHTAASVCWTRLTASSRATTRPA